ncbi:MAG: GNAT family N-acetyltransferase [Solirubrobacteraceae bacterium]
MSAERQRQALRGFYRAITEATPGGRVVELDGGIQAAIVDLAPDRSVPNAVVYEDGEELREALDDLADLYADAGVRAWTVWVRPGDEETARALRDAGHRLDGRPALMAATLADMDLAPRRDLDLVRDAPWEAVGAINDAAWGLGGAGFEALLAPVDPSFSDRWVARVGGRPAACVVTWTHDAHVHVWLVATDPAARGQGLCSELMRTALREARDAGAQTTSLEGSPMGEPVYAALGYETLGRLALYERRVGAN